MSDHQTDLVERVAKAIDAVSMTWDEMENATPWHAEARAAIAVVLEDMMDELDCPYAKDVEAALETYARQNSIAFNPKERP